MATETHTFDDNAYSVAVEVFVQRMDDRAIVYTQGLGVCHYLSDGQALWDMFLFMEDVATTDVRSVYFN